MIEVNYADAIRHLVPNSQFSYDNDDLDTLVWDGPEGKRPSNQEIIDAVEIVKQLNVQKAADKAAARAQILDRLGLTDEEASILLG
jgi:hypothetical protein